MKIGCKVDEVDNPDMGRRRFFTMAPILAAVFSAAPAFAIDLFKLIDPKGQSKDIQRAKKIFQGVGSIVSSATGLDYKSEFAIGQSLALEGFKRFGLPAKDKRLQKYVSLVGDSVAKNSTRSDIPYYFVVLDVGIYNAFSCPGGIVFVSSELIKHMEDESELACVLGHEIAHVAHKHALQSIRRAKFFEGVGKITTANMKGEEGRKFQNMIGNLQTVLFDKGLDKNMEYEADLSGMESVYKTGYDPGGLIRVLNMLKLKERTAVKRGSWFSTHPPLPDRIKRCSRRMTRYPDAKTLARVKDRFVDYKKLI